MQENKVMFVCMYVCMYVCTALWQAQVPRACCSNSNTNHFNSKSNQNADVLCWGLCVIAANQDAVPVP